MKPHFNIVFATPANSFTPGYLESLLKTISLFYQEGISWTFLSHGGSLVSMARECTIAGSGIEDLKMKEPVNGAFTYDMIIWIDSDISWSPSDIIKLYKSDKKIISGCYLMENGDIPIYFNAFGSMIPESEIYKYDSPFKVAGCGFGFIGVKSGVFENMPRPWFGPVEVKTSLEGPQETLLLIGEDLSWCTKAINCGFDIWVDPSVKVIHEKSHKLLWQGR